MTVVDDLVVKYRADLKDLVQGERTAVQSTKKTAAKMSRSFGVVDAKVKKLKTSLVGLKGTIAGIGIAAVLTGGIRSATNALEEFDRIAKQARTAGLSGEFYQTLGVAAEEAGVAQGLLNSSLLAFVKRVGEAKANTGPLAGTLKKLNAELFEQLKASTTQEEALRIIADAMNRATSATDRAALASAAFSRAGIELTRILVQGSAGLDRTAAKARRLGLILDNDLLKRAEDIQNEFGLATKVLDLQFKQLMVDLAPVISDVTRATSTLVKEINGLTGGGNRLSNSGFSFFSDTLKNLKIDAINAKTEIVTLGQTIKALFTGDVAGTSKGVARLLRLELPTSTKPSNIENTELRRFNLPSADPSLFRRSTQSTTKPSKKKAQKKTTTQDIINDINAEIEALKSRTMAVGQSEGVQARLNTRLGVQNALQRANLTLTPKQSVLFKELYEQIEIGANHLENAQKRLELFNGVGTSIGDGLATVFGGLGTEIKDLDDSFDSLRKTAASVLNDIRAQILKSTVSGPVSKLVSSGLSSLLTSFFGGARAEGGPVSSGKAYLVGEKGPEMFSPPSAGNIIPNHKLSGGGGSSSNVFNISIDARGAVEGVAEQISKQIEQVFIPKIIDAQERGTI